MTQARVGLLTGAVGVGKTTVAGRVIELARQQGLICGGLLAPAMMAPGGRIGIWGVDIGTGERRVLARTDGDLGGPAIGPYSFDAAALAWAVGVVQAARNRCDLLVVDEIGKLELWQGIGLAPVLPWLAAGAVDRALVVVRDSLLAELQARLGSVEQVVFYVNEQNRGDLPPLIVAGLACRRGSGARHSSAPPGTA